MAILATCTLISFANASNTNSKYYEISLQQIIENNADCVREICSNKIYLKTDSIFISEKGVYMMLNDFDDYAYLPELCTDADGYFIRVNFGLGNDFESNADQAGNYQRKCSECGRGYYTSCKNPDCPKNKR